MMSQIYRSLNLMEIISGAKSLILENLKVANSLVKSGKLDKILFDKLMEIDKTPTKKYMGWLGNIYIQSDRPNLDVLNSYIEKWDDICIKNKIQNKDIYQFKTFKDLVKMVDDILKDRTKTSKKELAESYEVLVNNEDLFVVYPHTHEASRRLGMKYFSFKGIPGTSKKECSWCTTHANKKYWTDYLLNKNETIYYIKPISNRLLELLNKTFPNHENRGYAYCIKNTDEAYVMDGLDDELTNQEFTKWKEIIFPLMNNAEESQEN